MVDQRLSPEAARRVIGKVIDELGRVDRTRLESLLTLPSVEGRIRLSEALAALFPQQKREAALTAFRQFRGRLQKVAEEAGINLTLEVDSQTRSTPDQRWCWFAGENGAAEAAARFVAEETAHVERTPQAAIELTEMHDGKPVIRYFVSYAHKDWKLKDELLERLKERLAIAKEYYFDPWDDGEILAGERWHEQIQAAVARCQFGLLLVSPAFLGRAYIKDHELPAFVASNLAAPEPDKRAIPVALKRIPFDNSIDLKGLERLQVFQDSAGKAFQERRNDKTRDDFASELFQQILKIVKRYGTPPLPPFPPSKPREGLETRLRRSLEASFDADCFVHTHGFTSSLDKMEVGNVKGEPEGERRDALAFLDEWARNPQAQPYCALLGEYGIGKTTTCMAFAHQLLNAGKDAKVLPLPIYLDLRHVGEKARDEPDLKTILNTVLQKSWRGGHTEIDLRAEEVIRLVQQEGALAIFDGLDEVLVHLSPAAGQGFTREIFRLLPPALVRSRQGQAANGGGRSGRLLVTCRTHYFRTLRDQKTLLTAEDRDGIRANDYRAFVLLPFTEDQIRAYLAYTLPHEDPERVLELIRTVHNLSEMAERPYTLSLITRHIPQIERWKLEGRRVTGVMLYRHMVLSWLERDAGKHQLTPEHKQRLMEYFAAALWRSGRRVWSVGDLEQWLIDFLRDRPDIAAHYGDKDRELLKEDLRTATFLVREGEDSFRFAHTSLQEFFLAGYLRRALVDNLPDDWALSIVSPETLDFLGQLLDEGDSVREPTLNTLRALRDRYRPSASELALRYCLLAHAKGYLAPALAGFQLEGADLRGWEIQGKEGEPPLNLRGAVLHGARLEGVHLYHVDLEQADLSEARLARAELLSFRAPAARFAGADLTGTVFRSGNLTDADFTAARCHRSQWLDCRLEGVTGLPVATPEAFYALCKPADTYVSLPEAPAHLAVLDGHVGGINMCAFAPDGRRLASASDDGTLRLWETASGECLAVLRGHEDVVRDCAFASDGRRLASASWDRTLRLWETASGECLAVLRGHKGLVFGCAFAPDGRRLASASDDETLRLWETASGKCLAVLGGHKGPVFGCAFSPDGRRLASASRDRTLRLWETASGKCLAMLRGHKDRVLGCAFSPDGRRLASASGDRTLRLWETASGECLAVLRGHEHAVWGCAFAPDGRRLASASEDRTLRLWETASGECLAVLRGHEGPVSGCAFTPDGRRLASASWDGTLLWDVESGECLAVLRGHEDRVRGWAFAPDGRRLASSTYGDGTLRLWETTSGECLAVLRGHEDLVLDCAFAPDGRRLASASGDQTLRLWETASGECLAVLRGHEGAVEGCAFTPDGRRLASASEDETLRLWETASGECLAVLRGHENAVWGCAFAPDGRRLASASDDGTLRLWETASGECLAVLRGHERRRHEHPVRGCAFAPDGRRLASASEDGTLRLWETASGECLAVLRGHEGPVLGCAFAPDGRRLASASWDGTLRLWETASGERLAVLRGHEGPVLGCAFAPDGRRLASASMDGTMRFWDVDSGREVGPHLQFFANGAWASLDLANNRIVQVAGDAWRWLGWLARDPATGSLERYPAEVFGPLPESRVF